jgi:hypothetical protein
MPLWNEMLPHLVHVGAILYLVCFLFRNQIMLRSFAIFGDFAYIAYYYAAAERPLWEAMFYAGMNVVINLIMIALVLRDLREGGFSERDLQLFRRFSPLSPGEFRRLMRGGVWTEASEDMKLTEEGDALEKLYYVMEGAIEIEKAGRKITPDSGIFIGEIAFLSRKAATATALIKQGTRYVVWEADALRKQLAKDDALQGSLMRLLNADLAAKVAKA